MKKFKHIIVEYLGSNMSILCVCKKTGRNVTIPLFRDNGKIQDLAKSNHHYQLQESKRAFTYIVSVKDKPLVGICSNQYELFNFRPILY